MKQEPINETLLITKPPKDLYTNKTGHDQILDEDQPIFVLENDEKGNPKIEFTDDGIKTYIENAEYPMWGWPDPETIFAINQVKRLLVNWLSLISILKFGLLFVLFDISSFLNKVVNLFVDSTKKSISPYLLKYQYLTRQAKATKNFLYVFLSSYVYEIEDISIILAHIIEYDNAYRFRLEDILSETTKELLQENPQREFRKLKEIYLRREQSKGVIPKVNQIFDLIIYCLYIPDIKRNFIATLDHIDFTLFQYTDADKYWTLMHEGYNYRDMTLEERQEELKKHKIPRLQKIQR